MVQPHVPVTVMVFGMVILQLVQVRTGIVLFILKLMTITVLNFLLITVRFVDSIGIGDYHCLNLSFRNQVKKWKTNVVYIVLQFN